MKDINVNKAELLKKLERNLALHKKIFKDTHAAFKKNYFKELQKLVADAKRNKFSFHLLLNRPTNYAQSYKDAIKMVEMDCRDIIVLSENEFMSYVLNKWDWIGSFRSSYMANSGTSGCSGSSGSHGVSRSSLASEYFGDGDDE